MLQRPHRAHAEAIRQFGQAAREGHTDDLERLLREVEDLKIDDSYWGVRSALAEALNAERVGAVRWLVGHGASVNAVCLYHAYKALASECTSDRESIVLLLHKGRASVGSKYEPFHDPAVMIQAIGGDNSDQSNSLKVLELLIRRGADVNAVDSETQLPPLIQALTSRREDMVRLLLKAGAQVDTRVLVDQYDILAGETALMVAAVYSLNTSVRLLLERGASVTDVGPENWTALMKAVASANHHELDAEVVNLLANAGSPINAQTSSGETALMLAALYEGNEIDEYTRYYAEGVTVQFLLDHGASVDLVDSNNWTALMYAASKGNDSIMTRLIEAGSPLNAQSKDGETALTILLDRSDQYFKAMKLLLDRGASIDLADDQGWTPILFAAARGHHETVRLLLERGATLDAEKTANGYTIYSLAQMEGHEMIEWVLHKHVGAIEALAQPTILNSSSMDLSQAEDGSATASENNWTLLMEACTNGDNAAALRLLQAGVPIDGQTVTGETALMRAVSKQHASLVKVLVEKGATLDLKDKQDFTALMKAVNSGNTEISECLLQGGASINVQGNRGETVLMLAAFNGNEPIVQVLINHGANVNLKAGRINLDWRYQLPGWTAIMFAAYKGFGNVVNCLIQAGAAINPSDEFFCGCDQIPLTCAAKGGYDEVVRMLLYHGANVDAATTSSDTALVWAIRNGHESVAQILIEFGANLEFGGTVTTTYLGRSRTDEMYTPLMCAAENGREEFVRLLLQRGASVDVIGQYRTALLRAAEEGHNECVRLLLQSGASVTHYGSQYSLMNAAGNGHHECVRLLIQAGASVDFTNGNGGNNVLMCAAENGHDECVQLLLEAGALIDQQHDYGCTALIYAAKKGFNECVRLLVQHGASIDFKDKKGFTALIFAADRGHEECVRILLQTGPIIDMPLIHGQTILMRASMHGQITIVDLLILQGASVDMVDDDNTSALMWAARKGYAQVVYRLIQANAASVELQAKDGSSALSLAIAYKETVQVLVNNGAPLDTPDCNGKTPLMIATECECDEVVRFLVEAGASKDKKDHKQSTAMRIAILKGNAKIVGILRENGASMENPLFTLAVDFGEFKVMRELLCDNSCFESAVAYLQDGLPRINFEPAESQPTTWIYDSDYSISTDRVFKLCTRMRDATIIFSELHSRIVDLGNQLKMQSKIVQREPLKRFMQIIKSTQSCLDKYSSVPTIIHLVSSRQHVDECRSIHEDLDEFMEMHWLSSDSDVHNEWKGIFEKEAKKYLLVVQNYIQTNNQLLLDELLQLKTSQEALVLLRFECDKRASLHTEEEMKLLTMILDQASKLSSPAVPEWFIPPQDIDKKDFIAKGGFGSVHRASYLGADVIVKTPLLLDTESREMFLREANIWYRLDHSNIIQLYGACHLEKPMLVCERAANDKLSDFLGKKKDPATTWEKLYQAAAGLQYMHEVHKVVHGDLKCDNILVGVTKNNIYIDGGPAKLTDFGLSYDFSKGVDPNSDEIAAIQWKAPEVIKRRIDGSFASDVYSLGMCILEAVKGGYPWGNFPDVTVKHMLLKAKQLPKRPQEVNDAQWELITRMIAWDPLDRPRIGEVVDILKRLAQDVLKEAAATS